MSDHLLSPIITAHCFWSPRCKHTVSDRPDAAHAAMEAHYAAAHGRDMTWRGTRARDTQA